MSAFDPLRALAPKIIQGFDLRNSPDGAMFTLCGHFKRKLGSQVVTPNKKTSKGVAKRRRPVPTPGLPPFKTVSGQSGATTEDFDRQDMGVAAKE